MASVLFYWLCAVFIPGIFAANNCSHNKADIVFLLDSSYSEGAANFKKQLDFVRNFTNAFDIGRDKVQISVVTFSTSPHNAFYLKDHVTKSSVQYALQHVSYTPGSTVTDKALQYIRDNSFLTIHGGRYGVPKIVVVMTDGLSSQPTATAAQARVLHYAGIKVIAIGIGSQVKSQELTAIASDPQHAFKVTSFNSLQTIEHDIQNAACISEKVETCDDKRADIIFVLDGSGSEGKVNFQKQLMFVANFTNNMDIGPHNIQIGLVTFGTHYHNEFYLNGYTDKHRLAAAIRNVTYLSGTTNTAEALDFVRLHGFATVNGGRGNSVSRLVVVLTDGRSNTHSRTVTAATALHHTGVQVIAVGIGTSLSTTELGQIATDPGHAFNVANFNSLSTVQNQIESAACTTPQVCGSTISDVVFMLDSSSSVGSANFQKQLDFVTSIVQDYDVGPSAVQFGLVTYSTTARNEFYLSSYRDKFSLMAAIQTARYHSGTTGTDQGLHSVRYYQFSKYHGGRSGASLVLIAITDGRSNDITKTLTEAKYLKNANVTITVVGVGPTVNKYEINALASDSNHAFFAGSFDILHTFKGEVEAQACGSTTPKPTAFPECGSEPADIIFLLDSSASEGATNFQKQVDFVRDFSYQFQIGPKDVQIGVVTFSSRVTEIFPLNRYHDQSSLLTALTHVAYHTGATYTNLALNYARTQSFLTTKGGRPNAKKIVIVVTDGQSTHPNLTLTEATSLKHVHNMTVVAIGVGNGVSKTELAHIASDSQHTFSVTNFDALERIKSELTFTTCTSCEFISKADIVFVVDSSSGVGAANFHKQLDFIARVANDLNIGTKAIQIGVVSFSSTAHNDVYLNRYTTKATLISGIQKISYHSGSRHTYQGLRYANTYMFSTIRGARAGVNKYLVLLTNGPAYSHYSTLNMARTLKQHGITVITVGIGSKVNKAELAAVASDANHNLHATDFDQLQTLRDELMGAACQDVITTTRAPTTTTTTRRTTHTTRPPTTSSETYLTLWP